MKKGEVKSNFDSAEKLDEKNLKISSAYDKKRLVFGGLNIGLKESGEQ